MIRRPTAKILSALILGATVLAACDAPRVGQTSTQMNANGLRPGAAGFSVVPADAPSGPLVDNFAISVLNNIQARSIAEGREYCGYIFVDQFGRLQSSPPVGGTLTGCNLLEPRIGQGVLASYHTHGSYSPALAGEVPSSIDLQGDFNYGINGYVATPGGRVWLNEARTRSTRQLCGIGCITSDPRFVPLAEGAIRAAYSEQDIARRSGRF